MKINSNSKNLLKQNAFMNWIDVLCSLNSSFEVLQVLHGALQHVQLLVWVPLQNNSDGEKWKDVIKLNIWYHLFLYSFYICCNIKILRTWHLSQSHFGTKWIRKFYKSQEIKNLFDNSGKLCRRWSLSQFHFRTK